jgi:hypothetical protein
MTATRSRIDRRQERDRVLITGASGGAGTALPQLGHRRLTMYGTASRRNFDLLTALGAPSDYHTQRFRRVICAAEPAGPTSCWWPAAVPSGVDFGPAARRQLGLLRLALPTLIDLARHKG